MNVKPLQQEAKPALLKIRIHPILFLGTILLLNETNLSSLAEHISKEKEMEVTINIIKYRKD